MTGNSNSGGARPGAGRPRGNRSVPVSFVLSPESAAWLKFATTNKSQYVDELILKEMNRFYSAFTPCENPEKQ